MIGATNILRVIALWLLIFGIALYAQVPVQAGKIKRRVLLLDFVNNQKDAKIEYLSQSVPESLIQPLSDTGFFEVLSRDLGNKLIQLQGIEASELFSDSRAVELGKQSGAEVVIIGNYTVIEGSVRIQAKAIDVLAESVSVTHATTGKLDATMFGKIDELASRMAEKMTTSLPPLEKRTIFSHQVILDKNRGEADTGIFIQIPVEDSGAYLNIAAAFDYPLGNANGPFGYGFGGQIMIGSSIWSKHFNPFFTAGYHVLMPGNKEIMYSGGVKANLQMLTYNGGAGLQYPLFVSKLLIRPFVAAGSHAGYIKPEVAEWFVVASLRLGAIVDFLFFGNKAVSFGLDATYLFEKRTSLLFLNSYLGLGVRF